MTFRRKLLLGTVTFVIVVGILEAGSAIALKVLSSRLDYPILRTPVIYAEQTRLIRETILSDSQRAVIPDSVLGWVYRANWRDDSTAHTATGVRSLREYTPSPSPGVLRVSAFGDSFVYGNEVPGHETWAALMEESDSSLEVLNYGVGGYGVDQALLRFQREGRAMNPAIVIIGFTTDDMRRIVNVYRRFLSVAELPLFKPRFHLNGDSLRFIPNPVYDIAQYRALVDDPRSVRQYGEHDQWFEPLMYRNPLYDWSATTRLLTGVWIRVANRYVRRDRMYDGNVFNTKSAAFALQLAVFRAFRDSVISAGFRPVILLLPDRESVTARANGGRTLYSPLAQQLGSLNMTVFDASDAFAEKKSATPVGEWFRPGGHYSRAGNLVVAEWLTPQIRQIAGRAQ